MLRYGYDIFFLFNLVLDLENNALSLSNSLVTEMVETLNILENEAIFILSRGLQNFKSHICTKGTLNEIGKNRLIVR